MFCSVKREERGFFDQPQWKYLGIEYLIMKIYSLPETLFKSSLIFSLSNAWIRLKVILDLAFAYVQAFQELGFTHGGVLSCS